MIAGQGTIAMELLDQVKNLDAIVAPVGGGGMIAGPHTIGLRILKHTFGHLVRDSTLVQERKSFNQDNRSRASRS